ncbi:MAG: universal stress protein [Rhodothermales bacterium]|nr:universal stress protein [Rhodothermales bacterium]
MRSILVPVDASSGSEAALHFGRRLAEKRNVAVHVVHVAATPPAAARFKDEFSSRLSEVADGGLDVTVEAVAASRPDQAIIEQSQALDVDAIFMGKHGSRTTDRLLTYLGAYGQVIGTTAEYVVRTADRPVLLTSPRFVHGPVDIRRILIAIDFSDYTPSAIRVGRELATLYNAEIEFIHVRNGGTSMLPPEIELESTQVDFCNFVVRKGQVDKSVIDRIAERGVDMLVIHSHGHTSDRRARLGEMADKLIRSAPCSVLTIKSFGKALVEPDDSDRQLAARFFNEIAAAT